VAEDAMKLGRDSNSEGGDFNENMAELLLNIPGVDFKNYRRVMFGVKNLRELCGKSLGEFQTLVGAENGRKMFNFFHMKFTGVI
jgi:hypothetical protein